MSEVEARTSDQVAKMNGVACAFTSFVGDPGLTKREYFAAMALQGFCANPVFSTQESTTSGVAAWAVEQADAVLKELAK